MKNILFSARCHQHHHDLTAYKAACYKHMAQKAAHCRVVKGAHFKACCKFANGYNYAVGDFVLDKAIVNGDNFMGRRLVHPRNKLSAAFAERRLYLVSVMGRVFHADYVRHAVKPAEKLYHLGLFKAELAVIVHVLKLATAAFFKVWAIHFLSLILFCPKRAYQVVFFYGRHFYAVLFDNFVKIGANVMHSHLGGKIASH